MVAATVEPNATCEVGVPASGGTQPAVEPAQPTVTPEQEAEVEEVVHAGKKAAPGMKFITHKVGPNESLGTIAQKYGVDPQQLKDWNSLRRNQVRVGQKLLVQVPDGSGQKAGKTVQPTPQQTQQAAPATKTTPQPQKTQQSAQTKTGKQNNKKKTDKTSKSNKKKQEKKTAKPTTYTVKEGDSYERIAKRNGVSVDELKKANKAKSDVIHPGDKVTIPAKKGAKTSGKSGNAGKTSKKKSKKRR